MAAEGIDMGGDELGRPPRWADALLRTCLSPEEAETQSGDLLEAYRDSVLPHRGRLSADVWFVRQVAGYMLRARGMKLRNWILAGLALSALTIIVSVLLYPGILEGSDAAKVAVGFLFYAYAAVCHTRPATPEDAVVLSLGSRYGLAIGSLWVGGVLALNLGVGIMGVVMMLHAFLLPVVAGAHAGIKLWRVGAGMLVGFWSSLVSGLSVFLGVMASGYILAFLNRDIPGFIPGIRRVLLLIFVGGVVVGVVGATIGSFAGILLARTGRSPEEPRRVFWGFLVFCITRILVHLSAPGVTLAPWDC
jgi:hypothetical protein